MRKTLSFVICIIFVMSSLCMCAHGASSTGIEQVYSRMPDVRAYMHIADNTDTTTVTGFVDSSELTLISQAPFNRADGVSFILMFDCSTSVTGDQMNAMKNAANDFVWNNPHTADRYTIVSFGETINTVANGTYSKDEAVAAINTMANNQNGTVLYAAVEAVKNITDGFDDTHPQKRMCVIFTDAVDYNLGGTTDSEVLSVARTAGTPIYAVAINPNNKESIDSLGAIARTSGGDLSVAEGGNIALAFQNALSSLNSIYEIRFSSGTNKASLAESTLTVSFGEKSGGNSVERKFRSVAWQSDAQPPVIESHKLENSRELVLTVSEKLTNADNPKNFTVKKGKRILKIHELLYNKDANTITISFDERLGSGKYEITTANITDASMEANLLAQSYEFKITGFKAFLANVLNFCSNNKGWMIGALITLAVALIAYMIIRKRGGIVIHEGKPTFSDNIKIETKTPPPLPKAYIKLIMEKSDGTLADLDINIVNSVIFGRSPSCEVTIDDQSMSRQHFAVELEDGMLFVQNLSQTNGTLLNGVLLQGKRKLNVGDTIAAGQEVFTVAGM